MSGAPSKDPRIRFVSILDRIPVAARAAGKQRPGFRAKIVLIGETADGKVHTATRTVSRPKPTEAEALAISRTRVDTLNRRQPLERHT